MISPFRADSIGNTSDKAEKILVDINADKNASFLNAVSALYDSLKLNAAGLSKQALEYGYKGYQKLLNQGSITHPGLLTICDFSQSSRKKRLYVIDMNNYKLLMNTFVAHGKNTGAEYATSFSNNPESLQSSLGFYVTRNPYQGKHGLSLKIDGMEKGFNDNALERDIVIHGANYTDKNFTDAKSYLGRSWGCPAVPQKQTAKIINTIKDGTCLFIYHPTSSYLHGSMILNG
ncbi:MAG: murein L,D-transpeptidase catalytic domain family protein [Bacteroidota bacterium]|nr:murein L,D-transpeptidase catalytic domain family protein [Bacteroidota bacterium]